MLRNWLKRESACVVASCVYGGRRGVPEALLHSGFIPLFGHFPSDIWPSGISKKVGKDLEERIEI